jgi:hypothetical protein
LDAVTTAGLEDEVAPPSLPSLPEPEEPELEALVRLLVVPELDPLALVTRLDDIMVLGFLLLPLPLMM